MAPLKNMKKDYKILITWLSDSIRTNNFEELKFLLEIPDGAAEEMTSFDLLKYIEEQGKMGPENLEYIIEAFTDIGRNDLAKKVREFGNKHKHSKPEKPSGAGMNHSTQENVVEEIINQGISEQVYSPPPHVSNLPTVSTEDIGDNNVAYILPAPARVAAKPLSSAAPAAVSSRELENDQVSSSIPLCYTMESQPRGKFVIISNSNFETAREQGRSLVDRPGTTKDVTKLEKTFDSLFNVIVYSDLTGMEMEKCLSYFASIEHTEYDCFACCILTHGNHTSLYGIDGEELNIQHALSFFKMTPTLKGKPKIFFFQACRGVRIEKMYTQDSGYGDTAGTSHVLSHYTIPNGADFFLGYATPPGYISWIGKEGSWYISALCEAFVKYGKTEDIHSITSYTNDLVSKYDTENGDKQIPSPEHTLRKKLYFYPNKCTDS